jgi:hypothetical protein
VNSDKLKIALLKTGQRIGYDTVTVIEETHVQAGLKKHKIYQFARGGAGIVAVIPAERVAELEA